MAARALGSSVFRSPGIAIAGLRPAAPDAECVGCGQYEQGEGAEAEAVKELKGTCHVNRAACYDKQVPAGSGARMAAYRLRCA